MSNKLLSTPKQRQDLGFIRKLLGLDEDTYYEMMFNRYGVRSSKELTKLEITEFINILRDNAKEAGLFKPKASFNKYRYHNMDCRDKMATPAQLRKIESMWFERSRAETREAKTKALRAFIKRIVGKDSMTFITMVDVRKIIKALENM